MTVAMLLAENCIISPKEWYHNPKLRDNNGMTVALYIAKYCNCIPDEYWNHDPKIHNKGWTVARELVYNSIIPPK